MIQVVQESCPNLCCQIQPLVKGEDSNWRVESYLDKHLYKFYEQIKYFYKCICNGRSNAEQNIWEHYYYSLILQLQFMRPKNFTKVLKHLLNLFFTRRCM